MKSSKRWLTMAFAATLAACGSAASDGPAVSSAEAHKLVSGGATLLDVRSLGEWQQRHIEGAVLVPVGELEARITEIPRDKPVVVYCASGGRSATATAKLRAAGYDARNLGGIDRWYE